MAWILLREGSVRVLGSVLSAWALPLKNRETKCVLRVWILSADCSWWFTHFYKGSSEYFVYSCYTETRKTGTSRVEVMSWASQPQSSILAHSASCCFLLVITWHLCPPLRQYCFLRPSVMLPQTVWMFIQGLLQKEVLTAMMNDWKVVK